MISKKGGNAPQATDLGVEKKQILRKPLYCTQELNTYSTEQTTVIHVSCVTSNFSYCTVNTNVRTVKSTNKMY